MQNPLSQFLHSPETDIQLDSISDFAKKAGVSYQLIHKAELGLYSAIPTSVVKFMAEHSSKTELYWQEQYILWVKEKVAELGNAIAKGHIEASALFVLPGNLSSVYPSFTEWRASMSYSKIDFCKTFFLHPAIMLKYENGEMAHLPYSLRDRLTFIMDEYLNFGPDKIGAYMTALENLATNRK